MSDQLVATLAFAFSGVAAMIGVGPWDGPYQLRTFRRLREARGMTAARAGWVVVALIAAACGMAILSDLRPFSADARERRSRRPQVDLTPPGWRP